MFLTQEKLIKKINQDRQRGALNRAQKRALEGLERWPDDHELALEAIKVCFDLADFHQAVSLLKTAIHRHPRKAKRTIDFAFDAFTVSQNPLLGNFIIEVLLRAKNVERVRTILKRFPRPFIQELIKRSETRLRSLAEGDDTAMHIQTDNDLLLGLLYIEEGQYDKAVEPLGRVMEKAPEDAKQIGSILLEFERELKDNAAIKFYLGLASVLLSHPDKAEVRFFQCLELEHPPLEKLLRTLESIEVPPVNHLLLKGETLIRQGHVTEGASCIEQYLSIGKLPQKNESATDGAAGEHVEPAALAHERLSLLLEAYPAQPEVVLLFAETAAAVGKIKRAVDAIEALHRHESSYNEEITSWLESREEISMSAPAQRLLTQLNLEARNLDKVSQAARMAAEMDPKQVPVLLSLISEWEKNTAETHPELLSIKAELKARTGDTESAEELLARLKRENLVDAGEIARLTGEVLKHGGITLGGVVSIIGTGLETGDYSQALPYVVEFLRDYPDSDGELAKSIETFAGENESRWPAVAELVDALAEEERLTQRFRILQAHAHLQTGKIERAVFEFDQLLILDGDIRYDLMRIYEQAAERYRDNTTLYLALYQLYLEEGQLVDAAHHLCRTLELDPNQIRDVIKRFNDLVKKEPDNRGIWEEMLKSALNLNHFELARETLKRAITALPEQEAASLHVYGARLSSASGNAEDTLRSLAVALTSPNADLPSIERQLGDIITRDPANPDALYLLGETLFRIGREDEAVSSFEHCLNLSPTYRRNIKKRLEKFLPMSAQPWLVSRILGEIAWNDGRHEDALRLFKTAQNGPPEYLPPLGRTIENLMCITPDDRRLKVLYAWNLILEKRTTDTVAYLEELLAHEKGLTKFIIDILLELVAVEPTHVEANRLLARSMIQTGQSGKSLEPVLRLLSIDTAPAETINGIVSEFSGTHENNCSFLIAYARLKMRCEEHGTSIRLYRQALEMEPACWEEIFGALCSHSWPEDQMTARTLLAVDCLITGERDGEAFEEIRKAVGEKTEAVDEIVARISSIVQRNPERERFSLGASLLLGAQAIDRAEELIEQGRDVLGEAQFEALRIEFAEMLEGHGHTERAASILRDILDTSPEREAVLRRIESTFEEWTSRELATGIGRVASGTLPWEEMARYIRVALDRGDPATALSLLAQGGVPELPGSVLTARAYLQKEQPILALAVLGSVRHADGQHDDLSTELLYLEGIASERIGDYGRATAAFSKILATDQVYRDCRSRVAINHTRFLQSTVTDEAAVLEKTCAISSPLRKGEDGT